MPYAQRDGSGDIVGIFMRPQPGLAEELVPNGTALTEKRPARVKRELRQLVKAFSDSDREATLPFIDQIAAYIDEGRIARAKSVVDGIGALPVLSAPSKQALKAKIDEAIMS